MKEWIARKLVRIVGSCYDRSYDSYCMQNDSWNDRWAKLARRLDFLRKLAVRIDKENAVEQMAREGWWG